MAGSPSYGSYGTAVASAGVATITGLSFGSATDRAGVVVAVHYKVNSYASGVTIGGVTATLLVQQVNTGPNPDIRVEFWGAEGVTGTSGSVVVTHASGTHTVAAATWGIYGAFVTTTSDTDTNTGSGTTIDLTALTVPTGGIGLAAVVNNNDGVSNAWTAGATSRYDGGNTTIGLRFSGADTTTAGTNTITADGNASPQAIIGIALAPHTQGSASLTQAGNTVSSTATVDVQAAASITQAGDTVSADYNTAGETLGEAALTQDANTVSATGTVDVQGTASLTQAGDTASATGTVETFGQAAITQAGDTTTATAAVDIVAAAALTQDGDTTTAAYTVTTSAAASLTQDGDTVAATFFSGSTADADLTQDGNTISATGTVLVLGVAALTQDGNTATSDALNLVQIFAALAQDDQEMGAAGVDAELRGRALPRSGGGLSLRTLATAGVVLKTKTGGSRIRAY